MEGIIRVTPEQMESTANEFSAKASTVSTLTTEMTSLVDGLSSIWEGEASMAFGTKFHQLDEDIQKVIRMIQEHSADLIEMARVYREAETANQDEIAGLSGDVIV